jgi:hypothetical protein
MIDLQEAKKMVIEELRKTQTVLLLNKDERKAIGLAQFSEVIQVATEVFLENEVARSITFLIVLSEDFPLILPKIYLHPNDREWVGFIPHVDSRGFVCLFDEDTVTPDPLRPAQLALIGLEQARKIVRDGLLGVNQKDFIDEFKDYWLGNYQEKKHIRLGFNMIEDLPACNGVIKYISLSTEYSGYSVVLHDDKEAYRRFSGFLKEKGYSFVEQEAFYLGECSGLKPPFNFSNHDVFRFIKTHFPAKEKQFERFINQERQNSLVLFNVPVNDSSVFGGLMISPLETRRNGYRNGVIKRIDVFNTFQRNDSVQRVRFDTFTEDRLSMRTDGRIKSRKLNLTIAGLGSIGSNLLPFLMPLGIDQLNLIDPDILLLENINRHLLGPEYIMQGKAVALRKYLLQANPLLQIIAHEKSVVQLINDEAENINQSDIIIVAIGKDRIEEYIFIALKENVLRVPVLFLWIEPYLMGGHALFIHPGHNMVFSDLYKEHLYRYNIVSPEEYNDANKQILLREAGCQGTYMPYGQKSVSLFLSSLVPFLYEVVDVSKGRNVRLTYKGKIQDAAAISLKLSDMGQQLKAGEIQIAEL